MRQYLDWATRNPLVVTDMMWNMAGTTGGSPRARVLGAWLRDARIAANLGTRELARKLDLPHAYISRWETAERMPRPEDVATVLTAVGVTGSERERLINLARSATEPNWVAVGKQNTSDALAALLEFEQTAKHLTTWSPLVVPGLLQTGDYTRAIMKDGEVPQQEITPRVTVRLSRRDVLTRRNAVPFHTIIGEEALRQVIGGEEVMADQLRQLLQFAEWPSVTVQVLRTGRGWHPGTPGSFYLMEFESGRPIVHLEHLNSSLFLYEDEEGLRGYVDAAAKLTNRAESPENSATLIAEIIGTLEKAP